MVRSLISTAVAATVFFLLWTGVVWFLWTHAPVFFTIVFGLFDLIMFMIVLSLWLGASTVQIEGGKVAVRGGLLGVGRRREFDCAEVSDITMPIRMQTGEASGTPYYDIEFTLGTGQKVTAGKGVGDKQEAEWLIAEMKKAMGLRAKAAGASAEN